MSLLAGPVLALAGLLAFSGVQKVAWPDAAAQAMRAGGLPGSTGSTGQLSGRLLGLVEVAVAAAALVWGNAATAAALAVVYAGFALFSWRLLVRTDATASCGCFGQAEAPVTRLHAVLNAVAAVTCVAAIAWPTGDVAAVLGDQPLAGLPFLVLTALAGWLWYVMLEVIPDLQAALQSVATSTEDTSR
ncbi:MAG: MauE/DoxX family redox-associated membrane protein [Acidimicrobiales bacterium]